MNFRQFKALGINKSDVIEGQGYLLVGPSTSTNGGPKLYPLLSYPVSIPQCERPHMQCVITQSSVHHLPHPKHTHHASPLGSPLKSRGAHTSSTVGPWRTDQGKGDPMPEVASAYLDREFQGSQNPKCCLDGRMCSPRGHMTSAHRCLTS